MKSFRGRELGFGAPCAKSLPRFPQSHSQNSPSRLSGQSLIRQKNSRFHTGKKFSSFPKAASEKLSITNEDLFSEPSRILVDILDRTVNGIYLSNEREEIEKALDKRWRKVSFSGSPGAYSELAAMEICPGCEHISSPSWGAAVAALISGEVERAVVPIESFYTKRIRILYDAMVKYNLFIVDEVFLNVSHMLLGVEGSKTEDIERIVSHPQALIQCEKYITNNFKNALVMELPDTAEAARQLAIYRPEKTAVIASRRAAYLYNLKVLEENVQDLQNNPGRFVVLAREEIVPEDVDPQQCKTSIFFGLPGDDKPGALAKALQFFSDEGINFIWLDTRKLYPNELKDRGDGVHYLFYANMEGSVKEERVQRALKGLRGIAPFMRVMGSHKMHHKFLEDFP